MIVTWVFLLGAPARAGCDEQSLLDAVERAESAFSAMDAAGFDAAMADGRQVLSCQVDPLTPADCAAWHRTVALDAFTHKNSDDAVLAFRAALHTTPGLDLPLSIAPQGHPLREQFEQAKAILPAGTLDLDAPMEGWIALDGQRSLVAPAGWPFIFQRFDGQSHVVETQYVTVGDPLPVYPTAASSVSEPAPLERKRSAALIGTGVAFALVSAGLYGGALAARHDYDQARMECDQGQATCDLDRLHSTATTTDALVIASLGSAGVAVTLVVVGF